MRLLSAVFVAVFTVGQASAQFGSIAFPALGHAPSGNAWGNVVTPAIPQGAAALASGNRYGNLVSGFRYYGGSQGSHRVRSSSVYAFPVYIGGTGYYYGNGSGGDLDQAQAAPSSATPVVINQYFGTPPPDQSATSDRPDDSDFHFYQQTPAEGEATPAPSSYYLIAFKDHTIYSAVAYYIDGDTLHYFTAGNVHNQVSLSLVDTQLTEQLNLQRKVDIRLP